MFQRFLGERSWNLVNEEDVVFWSRRPYEVRSWGEGLGDSQGWCWCCSYQNPVCDWLGYICYLQPFSSSQVNPFLRLMMIPKVGPLGVGEGLWGTGIMVWGTVHICRVDLIRTSDSQLLFLVGIIYPPVFEPWLTHLVISHLPLEVPRSEDIFQLH